MPHLIDAIDRKIIRVLQEDGRMTYSNIANRIQINRVTVKRHLMRLLEDKLVTISAFKNHSRLRTGSRMILAIQVKQQELDTVVKFLVAQPPIVRVATTFGRYNIFVSATFDNYDEMSILLVKLKLNTLGVVKCDTFMVLRIHPKDSDISANITFDDTDEEIYRLLRHDGRMSISKLAQTLGTSQHTVQRRINRMVDSRFIRVLAPVELSKISSTKYGLLLMRVDPRSVENLTYSLKSHPAVVTASYLTGYFNMIVSLMSETTGELASLAETDITEMAGVLEYDFFECEKTYTGPTWQ